MQAATTAGRDLPRSHDVVHVGAIRRMLWVSGMAALASAIVIVALGRASAPGEEMARLLAAALMVWCLVALGVAAWISRVALRLQGRDRTRCQLGQYTLEDKIGEGGMGVVFRARHAMLRRPTVVKLLPPERAGASNLARFEREVQLTSQLSSPNTVAVYDFGRTPEGIFYYAMEYLDGVDLDELVALSGPQPASRVVHLLAQVCAALAEAHGAGLVHRDIKPGNVMLCRQGGQQDVVKILDFGLVKDVTAGDVKLTEADTFLGTPLYLSPEAITQPNAVDGRSDLYAVGGLGYFLLTGRAMFSGRTVAEVCSKHLYEAPVPPSQLVPDVPADLEALLLSCLAKSPERRPQDATALRAKLLSCADASGWSDADAVAWWEAHPRSARAERAAAAARAPTVAFARPDGAAETVSERRLAR
jgi:eukaryotic-like serine/threonine-protein kinase